MPGHPPPALGVIWGRSSLGAFLLPRPGLGPQPRDPMKPNKLPKLSPQAQPVTFLGSNQGSDPSLDHGDFMPPAVSLGLGGCPAPYPSPGTESTGCSQAFEVLVSLPGTHMNVSPTSPPLPGLSHHCKRPHCCHGPCLSLGAGSTLLPLAVLLPTWAAGWTRIHSIAFWAAFWGYALGVSIPGSGHRKSGPPWQLAPLPLSLLPRGSVVHGSRGLGSLPLRAPQQPDPLCPQCSGGWAQEVFRKDLDRRPDCTI